MLRLDQSREHAAFVREELPMDRDQTQRFVAPPMSGVGQILRNSLCLIITVTCIKFLPVPLIQFRDFSCSPVYPPPLESGGYIPQLLWERRPWLYSLRLYHKNVLCLRIPDPARFYTSI